MQNIINLYKKISNKSYSTLAGSIAFFLIINGGSVFFLLINICNSLGYDIFNYLEFEYLPNQFNQILNIVYTESSKSNFSFIYIATTVISGSTLFYHLIKTTEILYETKITEINLLNRAFSIFLVIIFLVIIVLAFIVFLFLNYITKGTMLNTILKYLTMFFIPFLIIVFIQKVTTPIYNKIIDIIPGVLFSTIFWFLSTIGFSIYLSIFSDYKNSFGTISFFIVFMIWIYLLSQGLIIGFIINYNRSLKKEISHKILLGTQKG